VSTRRVAAVRIHSTRDRCRQRLSDCDEEKEHVMKQVYAANNPTMITAKIKAVSTHCSFGLVTSERVLDDPRRNQAAGPRQTSTSGRSLWVGKCPNAPYVGRRILGDGSRARTFSPTTMDCEGADDRAATNGPNYFKSSARERPAGLLSSLESIVRSLSGLAALKRFSMSARFILV
jgi:hypothetical protein